MNGAGAPGVPARARYPSSLKELPKAFALEAERRWDRAGLARRAHRPPEDLRIVPYGGHGGPGGAVVRGRVLDDPPPAPAVDGEGLRAAVRRSIARFTTHELPGVALQIRLGGGRFDVTTDDEGYFELRHDGRGRQAESLRYGEACLAGPYRGLTDARCTPFEILVPGPQAVFGVISDVDDTILHTGAQRLFEMLRRTVTGSELTRSPLPGAAELYRAFAGPGANPVFYVSSSPWNLHDFLDAFLRRHGFPSGPVLLRDLLGHDVRRSHATSKHAAIGEILELHPQLPFVLIGDSGQHDPEIYAEVVRRHPDRIRAVYVREVRLDPGDGRVEHVTASWQHPVPFVVAADSLVMARHAAELGLLGEPDIDLVGRAVAAET